MKRIVKMLLELMAVYAVMFIGCFLPMAAGLCICREAFLVALGLEIAALLWWCDRKRK